MIMKQGAGLGSWQTWARAATALQKKFGSSIDFTDVNLSKLQLLKTSRIGAGVVLADTQNLYHLVHMMGLIMRLSRILTFCVVCRCIAEAWHRRIVAVLLLD